MNVDRRRVFPPWFRFWVWLVTARPTRFDSGRILASRAPGSADIRWAHRRGVRLVINLQLSNSARPALLDELGIRELHLPVPDLTPPTQLQLETGAGAIAQALASGERVLVHCAAGLGRTGTLLACYFVTTGMTAPEAIAHVRRKRPGSVETVGQEAAVAAFEVSRR